MPTSTGAYNLAGSTLTKPDAGQTTWDPLLNTDLDAIAAALLARAELQGSTPGTQQTGHLNISGTLKAGAASIGGAISGTSLALTGAATVGTTLGVTGAASVGSLTSSGAISGTTGTFTGDLSTSTNLSIGGYAQSTAPVFASGLAGWRINNDGTAEFNNVRARGSIESAVFRYSDVVATAGSQIVTYSASTLSADCTTAASLTGSFSLTARNDAAGNALFAVGDRLRLKGAYAGGVRDSWATVTARSVGATTTVYTCTLQSGSTSATFVAGTAVLDYGPSGGAGLLTLSADGAFGSSANLSLYTHAGSPWSATTLRARLGNLNGSYGYVTDIYGLGLGDYSGGNYLTSDPTNGLVVKGGAGNVTLNTSGIAVNKSPDDSTTYLTLGRLKYYNTEGLSPGSAPQWTTSRAIWDYTVPNAEVSASKARSNVWFTSALGTTGPSITFELNAERNAGVYSAYAALNQPLVVGYGIAPPGPSVATSSLEVWPATAGASAEMRFVAGSGTTAFVNDTGGILTVKPSGAALTLDGQGNSVIWKVLYGSNKAVTCTVGTSGKAVFADPYGFTFSDAVALSSTLAVTSYADIGQPYAQYTLGSDQSIANGGASDTQLTLTTAVTSNSNITVDVNGTFTVAVAGKYLVVARAYWNVTAANAGTRNLKITTGAGGLLAFHDLPVPSGYYGVSAICETLNLAANATLKVMVYQTAGAGQKVIAGSGYTSVSIIKVA